MHVGVVPNEWECHRLSPLLTTKCNTRVKQSLHQHFHRSCLLSDSASECSCYALPTEPKQKESQGGEVLTSSSCHSTGSHCFSYNGSATVKILGFLFLMNYWFLIMYVCEPHKYLVPMKAEDSIRSPGTRDGCKMSRECWESNPGYLLEQQVLLNAVMSLTQRFCDVLFIIITIQIYQYSSLVTLFMTQ